MSLPHLLDSALEPLRGRGLKSAGRHVRLVAGAATTRSLWPSAPTVSVFWWIQYSNFGDLLNPLLVRGGAIAPTWAQLHEARLFALGSLVESIPDGFDGHVWGTGLIGDHPRTLPDARIWAVRGESTRERLDLPPSTPLGDPGLLAPELYPKPAPSGHIALVPHWNQKDEPWVRDLVDQGAKLVDPQRSPARVIADIASARAVVSSSLHGLIMADAYGIPAAWYAPEPFHGGTFKVRDYESALREPSLEGRWLGETPPTNLEVALRHARTPDPARVGRVRENLSEARDHMRATLVAETGTVNPLTLLRPRYIGRA